MAPHHCTAAAILEPFMQRAIQSRPLRSPHYSIVTKANFSTTPPNCARKDGNKRRGESALHGRFPVRLRRYGRPKFFPQPVLDPEQRTKVQTDPNHGLWGFFNAERKPLLTPEDLDSHGRAWTVPELRKKDFEDLWKLYWQCIREVNRVATTERERRRLKIGYGEKEAVQRMGEIFKTQKAIKHTLTERWYQFEKAREAAMQDPEINLYADAAKGEAVYTPADEYTQEQASKA